MIIKLVLMILIATLFLIHALSARATEIDNGILKIKIATNGKEFNLESKFGNAVGSFAAGLPDAPLKCLNADISKADAEAGVKISILNQGGWKLRVKIESPINREVHWQLKFKK